MISSFQEGNEQIISERLKGNYPISDNSFETIQLLTSAYALSSV